MAHDGRSHEMWLQGEVAVEFHSSAQSRELPSSKGDILCCTYICVGF